MRFWPRKSLCWWGLTLAVSKVDGVACLQHPFCFLLLPFVLHRPLFHAVACSTFFILVCSSSFSSYFLTGTVLHGDVMSLQGRMDLLELVRTRAQRLIRERDLALNVVEAMQRYEES